MDSYYKLRQLFYYKVRHGLLQIATGITKYDGFITNCDSTRVIGIIKRWTNPLWHCSLSLRASFPIMASGVSRESRKNFLRERLTLVSFRVRLSREFSRLPKFTIFTQTIVHLVNPPIFFGSIVFNFSWVLHSRRNRNRRQWLWVFFLRRRGGERVKQGALWSMWKW